MGEPRTSVSSRGPDWTARFLEFGLAAVIFLAPLPFGAVGPRGRLGLEIASLALLLVWLARSCLRFTPLPPLFSRVGLAGLVGLALLQITPLGVSVVSLVSPRSMEIRASSTPPPAELDAEERLLGTTPDSLDAPATLSVDPGATASALRTGAMIAALLLVATTVTAVCGARKLALASLITAGFQGLYGLLVLASDSPRIWHLPKEHYLGSATGTLINRNHFACLLAMTLACGMGLILENAKRRKRSNARNRLLDWFGGENSRNLLLGLPLIVGLAGLLASFSRGGIIVGLFALLLTILAGGRFRGLRVRLVVALLIVSAAILPLMQIGSERLLERYNSSAQDLVASGGRARVWMDTLVMASAFPLVGCGYGTFSAAYPIYRSPEVRLFYAHAHNDPLQALAEGGALGGCFLLLLFVPVFDHMVRSVGGAKGTLAVGLAAGLAAMLLHSLVDFNFHIPSNAATAAVLGGALLGLPWKDRT